MYHGCRRGPPPSCAFPEKTWMRGGRTCITCGDVILARRIEPDATLRQIDLDRPRPTAVEMNADPTRENGDLQRVVVESRDSHLARWRERHLSAGTPAIPGSSAPSAAAQTASGGDRLILTSASDQSPAGGGIVPVRRPRLPVPPRVLCRPRPTRSRRPRLGKQPNSPVVPLSSLIATNVTYFD